VSPSFIQMEHRRAKVFGSMTSLYTPARRGRATAWKTVDIQEQRVRVVAPAQGTRGFSSLCAEFGSSRHTGYLQRYQDLGLRGIAERSRKPQRSPRRTVDSSEQRVVDMRLRYLDWRPPAIGPTAAEYIAVVASRHTVRAIQIHHALEEKKR
jgi:hypothetical protein